MSKQAGNLISVAAVLAVLYLAYKNGLFASVQKLLTPSKTPSYIANPNYTVAINKANDNLVDDLEKIQGVQDAKDFAKIGPIYNPTVTLKQEAPAVADDGGSWSQRDGNYEPGNYQP